MSNKTLRLAMAAISAGSLWSAALTSSASASSLFFFKGPTRAPNERICLSFAQDQARRTNLQNIKSDRLAVSGTRDNFFAVMTCVGKVVVVMVSGDPGTNGSPLAQELFDNVRRETCIDGC